MRRRPNDFNAALKRLSIGICPNKSRQKRVVNIDDAMCTSIILFTLSLKIRV
jgi:hypothetical protein